MKRIYNLVCNVYDSKKNIWESHKHPNPGYYYLLWYNSTTCTLHHSRLGIVLSFLLCRGNAEGRTKESLPVDGDPSRTFITPPSFIHSFIHSFLLFSYSFLCYIHSYIHSFISKTIVLPTSPKTYFSREFTQEGIARTEFFFTI